MLIHGRSGGIVLKTHPAERRQAAHNRAETRVLGEGQFTIGAEHPGKPVFQHEERLATDGQGHTAGGPHDQTHVAAHHAHAERRRFEDRIRIGHRHGDVAAGRRTRPLEGEVAGDLEELTQTP